MKDLKLGDLKVKDSKDLGVDIYNSKNKRICFVNDKGCHSFKKWLEKREKQKEQK